MKEQKQEYRKLAKEIRKSLDIKSISEGILFNLTRLPEYIESKSIFTYCSFQDEVSTISLFSDNSKNWLVPKISGENLLVCNYLAETMEKNCLGIFEPTFPDKLSEKVIDMVILPALMADKCGNRLGYGKGYYDRFLNSLEYSPKKVILLPEELYVNQLPVEEHDYKCEIIVTQYNVYRV